MFLVGLDFLTPAGVTGGRGCGLGFGWRVAELGFCWQCRGLGFSRWQGGRSPGLGLLRCQPFLVLQSSLAVESLLLLGLAFHPPDEYRYQYLFSYLRKCMAPCK